MNAIGHRLYAATDWVAKFAYINILWLAFSLLGLVVLGFFPATISMFTVIRKWLMGETDIPIFSTFWNTYKAEFFRGNGLGLIIVAVGGLIIFDFVFIRHSDESVVAVIQIPLYMLILAVVLTMFYVIPVYVHYELRLFQMIKNSFLLMLVNPIENVVMISGIVAVFFLFKFIPGLGFFFGGSLAAAIMMATCYFAFNKIEKKKQAYKMGSPSN